MGAGAERRTGGPADPEMDRRLKHKELAQRIASSVVILPPVLLALWLGGTTFLLLMAGVAGLVAWEWCGLVDRSAGARLKLIAGVAAAASVLVVAVAGAAYGLVFAVAAAGAYALATRAASGFWKPVLVAGLFVGAVPAFAAHWVRALPELGFETALWLAASVVITDVAAYVSGRSIGGPKLWPRVSPKKTWAGLIGAMVATAAFGTAAGLFVGGAEPWRLAVVGGLLAVVAQAGDFAESAVKRHFHAKDSGTMIPGHGGILDRLDGQIAVMPVAACIIAWHGKSLLAA